MAELSGLRVFVNFFLVFSLCILVSSAFGAESDEALGAIDRANTAVASAYRAVLEAEEAGANVSGLLNDLNLGVYALVKADMLYRAGDFDEAIRFADLCYDSVVDVAAEADWLRVSAEVEGKRRFYFTFAASTFGVCGIIFGGLFAWRLFKKRYLQRVSKMRPEVVKE